MIHVDKKKIYCFVIHSSGAEHKVYFNSLRAWAAQASLAVLIAAPVWCYSGVNACIWIGSQDG